MSFLFADMPNFNEDISGWDVSSVTTMEGMFEGASSFDQDLSSWDVSKVTNAERMFEGAKTFDELIVCNWGDAWNKLFGCKGSETASESAHLRTISVYLLLLISLVLY